MRNSQTELIGTSRSMTALKDEIAQVARSDAKVLITGESGVGKELVARAIQSQSHRADRPFVVVNCAGLPETLLESEFFGHVKGSFTGAYRDKPGKLELADTGTVFLDEIGEMTLRMQALLLRFLETGELQKVGADRAERPINVRVIGATNRDLRKLIAEGTFREDLYYRLNVITLRVPPLRERKEDVPQLIEYFFKRFSANRGYRARQISPDAMRMMCEYAWPGNVRELENAIERLVVRSRDEVIGVDSLADEVATPTPVGVAVKQERRRSVGDNLYRLIVDEGQSFWTAVYPLYMRREITRENIRELVRRGLRETRGNYKIVARLFNMEPTDYKRFLNFLRKHDCQLPFHEFR
jgi:transcriptional regulator with GAF, ATPase, and Fis domain